MVSSLVVICYTAQIEAGKLCGLCRCPCFLYYMIFVGILLFPEHWTVYLFPWVTWLLMMKGLHQIWLEGSLNGLSLITSVFIFALPAWPIGVCAFCLSSPGFLIVGVESISILSLFLVSIGGFGVGF